MHPCPKLPSALSTPPRASHGNRPENPALSGTEAQVLLLVTIDRILDDLHRNLTFLPPDDLDSPALEVLVDVKEMFDLLQVMLRDVRNVEVLVVERVIRRNPDDLVIGLAAIEHLEYAERTTIDLTSRKSGLVDQYDDV